LAASGTAELLPEHVRVGLRRSRRDAETAGDLVVRAAGGDQLDHLTLPIRDDRRALMQQFNQGATLPTALRRAY